MNKAVLPTLIGVFSSLVTIWALHTVLIVKDCDDKAGTFDYATAKCLLSDGQVYQSNSESIVLALYFFVGFGVSFTVSRLIKKLLKLP